MIFTFGEIGSHMKTVSINVDNIEEKCKPNYETIAVIVKRFLLRCESQLEDDCNCRHRYYTEECTNY